MKAIESIKNERIKKWKKLQTKKGRDQMDAFLIEGRHLIEEALNASWEVEVVLMTQEEELAFTGERILVSTDVIKELATTQTPQGLMAVCKKRKANHQSHFPGTYVFIDRLQDPGNVGTIIRTALAANVAGVVLGHGTVDLYNEKVVRSTQGALFHIPIFNGELSEWIGCFHELKKPVIGTALQHAEALDQVEKQSEFALLVGNEGEGVAPHLLAQTTRNVFIPIHSKAESLNVAVATGVLLFSLQK